MTKLLDPDNEIVVPKKVAVCPYCQTQITISPDGWVQNDDGSWWCDSFTSWCETEPDIDSDEWDDWWETHNEMPYVYQLPVDEKIKSWMYKRFRFDLDSSP